MSTRTHGRALATRTAACLAGTGMLLGLAGPAFASDSIETPAQPPATSAGMLQMALDRAQQAVYDAQEDLDAAKAAEKQAYADLEALTSTAIEDATVALGVVVAAKTALDVATDLYEAAKKAQDEAQGNIAQLEQAVETAKAEVARTKVDGEAALEKVAEDYASRVLPAEADKLLRCAINKNSPACKDATARLEAAQKAHDEFAAPLREAADAYAKALSDLTDAELRLRAAQSGLGDLAVEALANARDLAQQAYEDSQRALLTLITDRVEAIARAGVSIGEAELNTEIKRQALRAAKAVLAELMAHNDFQTGDGTHLDDTAVTPEDVTAGNDGGIDDMGTPGDLESPEAGNDGSNDNMGVAPDPDDPVADNGSDLDNMGAVTPEPQTPATPEPETPAGPEVTPPSAVKPTTATTHTVVYAMKHGSWRVVRGSVKGMPRTAIVKVQAPTKGKAANIKQAKAKAKRIAAKHSATFAGTTYGTNLQKARVLVTWTTTS